MRGTEWAWNTLYGSPLPKDQPHSVLLGQSLGKILGCLPDKKEKVMDAVAGYKAQIRPFHCPSFDLQLNITTPSGQLNALDLTAVGLVDALYKDIDDKYILTSLEAAQTLMNTHDLSFVTVKMSDSGSLVDDMIRNFNQEAETSGHQHRMVRWQDHLVGDMYNRTMDLLSVFRNFVVSIIIVIAGLSTFNTMTKLVNERTREIGTLRSLGFLPRQILFLFVSESVVLSILGCGIGSILAVLFTFLINSLGIVYKAGVLVEPVLFRIMINFPLYIASFIFLSLLAALTTWLACKSTLKKNTAENLTYV
jgi:putative ABC transport system permease protein